MIKNIKKIYNLARNTINSNYVNHNATIKCDDGDGPYSRNYSELIDELKKEYIVQDGRFIYESRPNYVLIKMRINGFDCQISFSGSHYCGYVVDKQTHNIVEDNIDYCAHGGWTAGWGFDCAHCTDISFLSYQNKFPYDPPKGFGNGLMEQNSNFSTFKTKKFVIHELTKITESILRYQNQHQDRNIPSESLE